MGEKSSPNLFNQALLDQNFAVILIDSLMKFRKTSSPKFFDKSFLAGLELCRNPKEQAAKKKEGRDRKGRDTRKITTSGSTEKHRS